MTILKKLWARMRPRALKARRSLKFSAKARRSQEFPATGEGVTFHEATCETSAAELKAEARSALLRGVKFYAVGGIGIVVQLAALVVFRSILRFDYRLATVLAVEAAVVHNFLWHERFTWANRTFTSHPVRRFVKFNVTNGLLSIAGNLVLMQALVGGLGMNYFIANTLAIVACSLVNFVVSDRFVFQ